MITCRCDRERAERDVARLGVRCDEVVLVDRFDQKALEIAKRGIDVYLDDQDEMLRHVPEGVTVMKLRNGGNFDFEEGRWLYREATGRRI